MNGDSIGKYLTFELSGQCFAVDASRVEVILESMPITRVPRAPEHLRGVVNFRGAVIPVADMRTRFGEGRSPAGQAVTHSRFEPVSCIDQLRTAILARA